MVQFLGMTLGISGFIYILLAVLGDAGLVLGGIFCVGGVFAGLYCLMDRINRLEEKLDALARASRQSETDGPET